MSHYVLSRRAGNDLDGIWQYSAHKWSEEQADRYYQQLIQAFSDLAENPQMGRTSDIVQGYLRHAVRSHIVFYRKAAIGIEVIRILHRRMDFERHL